LKNTGLGLLLKLLFLEYVGMIEESDGTLKGDIKAGMERVMLKELVHGS